jgi:glycosidase
MRAGRMMGQLMNEEKRCMLTNVIGKVFFFLLVLGLAPCMASEFPGAVKNSYDCKRDLELSQRQADWRNGAVIYQILLDRFAPSPNLKKKTKEFGSPRIWKDWKELPGKGPFNPSAKVYTHELEFWGGDLKSFLGKLEYLESLGVEVIYLNPIFESLTNHKYDTWDFHKVDPIYGTREELKGVTDVLHKKGMKLVLDGVFNHMGAQSPMFLDAQKNPHGKYRSFFKFENQTSPRAIGWMDVTNLPELNLENPEVRDFIFARPDSVVQSYLRQEGIDGWRLDVGFDLGFNLLADLTKAAHTARPGCEIVGEIWNYPEEWYPSVDGVMNMHGRTILLHMLMGKIEPRMAAEMWESMITDSGMDHMLKTWLVLDNHDTPRLANVLPDVQLQKMARVLQFSLPGSVCLYYGSELGMTGGEDPEMRAPMRWDLASSENETLNYHRALITLRKECPALRYGDYRKLHSEKLFAFLRRTNSARDTVIVVANPGTHPVKEFLQVRESKMQDGTTMKDVFSNASTTVFAGLIEVNVPPKTVFIFRPVTTPSPQGYSKYDRIY